MKIHKLLLIALICGAPAAARAEFNLGIRVGIPVREAPPPAIYERVGPPPSHDYVWINGHWTWNGRWVWRPGYWERAHVGSTWVGGHWDRRGDDWVWIDGRWVAQYAPPPVYGPDQQYVVQADLPPPIVETYGPQPGPDYFWIGGHWGWHNRWVWQRGRWERHPHWHDGAGWVQGHWERRNGGNVWIEGRWR